MRNLGGQSCIALGISIEYMNADCEQLTIFVGPRAEGLVDVVASSNTSGNVLAVWSSTVHRQLKPIPFEKTVLTCDHTCKSERS
jgi:hypothetical protein